MSEDRRMTFWDLLDDVDRIEIPVIQRDYAQGRKTKEITDIRVHFIESLKNALLHDEAVDLNFIYGSMREGIFIPIDGQQRLTTLYLLHLYLLLVTGKDLSKRKFARIRRFTYRTRTSSNDFCNSLTSRKIVVSGGGKLAEAESVSREIRNNPWFGTAWLNDPTISAMLNMLDTIHKAFREEDLEGILDKLLDEDDCPIYFYFLELGEYSLEDSIYIKLNARGKALTDFENFKAKLTKFMSDELKKDAKEYIAKLDGIWSAVFWHYHNASFLYDDKIMNFIMAFVINSYAAHMKQTGRDQIRNEMREITSYSFLEFTSRFQALERYMDGERMVDVFVRMFRLFDLLADKEDIRAFAPGNGYIDEKQLFRYIIEGTEADKGEGRSGITYVSRIRAYACYGYLLKTNGVVDVQKYTEWLRIIRILSKETNYNGAEDYVRDIKGLERLLSHCDDILAYLSSLGDRQGHGFDTECFLEECIKAVLILKDSEWRELILTAEANAYFDGQIGFLLEFAGIIEEYGTDGKGGIRTWDAARSREFKERFRHYYDVMNMLFGGFGKGMQIYVGVNRDYANPLRRAMLCKGDFRLKKGYYNQSFLVDNDRDISWKRLLRLQSDAQYRRKRGYLKQVLDDSLFDPNDIAGSCEKICRRDGKNLTKMKKYFVTVPEIMDHLHDYRFLQPDERFIREEEGTVFLMGSTRLYGYNDEYLSYALYCLLKRKKGLDVQYYQARGWEDIEREISVTVKKTGEEWSVKYDGYSDEFLIWPDRGKTVKHDSVESAAKFFAGLA